MKTSIFEVPFFMNKLNMQYLLKGITISNIDELKDILFKNGYDVYKAREVQKDSEYPTQDDVVIGKAIRYFERDGKGYLEVDVKDSLYYMKLKNPCIKINGYCVSEDNASITITKVTRITIADSEPVLEDVII